MDRKMTVKIEKTLKKKPTAEWEIWAMVQEPRVMSHAAGPGTKAPLSRRPCPLPHIKQC